VTPLLLVGAGGLAREVITSVTATGEHQVVGILDDDEALHGTAIDGVPVIGNTACGADRDEQLLVCIGSGAARERVVHQLITSGISSDRFATHVDKDVRIPDGCSVGCGSILLPGVVLTAAVSISSHVVAMPAVVFTHDDRVASFATFAAGVLLGGGVQVGRGAYLGMGSAVRQRLTVGDYSTLGMGAVLVQDLPACETWAGVPARPLHDHQDAGRRSGLRDASGVTA
jgi:sugar O-acyltransferase (sialic acid O-acetyltransferase NeuD family)